uniref:Sodium/nucleoside cotransporter n=1 Tax=Oncorhynchus tshawytscha TaxID=74940 RepID=A0A8C8LWB4_ONCTS
MTEDTGTPLKVLSHVNGVVNEGFETQGDSISVSNRSSFKEEHSRKGLGLYLSKVSKPINATEDYFKAHAKTIKYIVLGLLGAGYVAYFITACILDFERSIALVVLTSLAVVSKAYDLVKTYHGDSITKCFIPCIFLCGLRVLTWLVVDTSKRPEQLISFGGVCMFILVIFIFSAHRTEVAWRSVFWGLGLQFCIGLFVIRTEPGLTAFQWLGEQVQIFLNYTKHGSSFVFGPLVSDIFAFQALPIVIFFSSVMSVLYFLGIMQWLIIKIAWVMQITMGTSPTETLSVAGNIFVGQTEAPLLIRPYLKDMTKSEVHAVMVGGFATIAGSVMGAFISFGIDASSMISASVMAAPCALAISKLSYPETEESKFTSEENIKVACGDEQNILEAASSGASTSIGLVANIAANLIAFLAILAFINASLGWLGGLVGFPSITFEIICSYVFMPVAFMMGIPFEESFIVAELIGTKLFLNEFLAYQKLSELKSNRVNGLDEIIGDERQWISVRSEIISTFALCGFANFSSLGIVIGGLSSICPSRRADVSSLVLRALFTGTCVSLINACIAGLCLFSLQNSRYNMFLNRSFSKSNLILCCSTVNNGTISFEGSWSTVTNATLYFTNCCDLFDNAVCN